MDLSIIIVNWNTRELLANCLQSVYEMTGEFEGFVVDNASTDKSSQMTRERFPQVRLMENSENIGFARANNQAILQSSGRYVLLLNSDTTVHPRALETMVQFMEDHPQAGACGPLLLNSDGSMQASCTPMLTPGREFWRLIFLDQLWHRATYMQDRWDCKIPHQVEVIKGACLLLRRAALDQVGLLDEQYFMYTEEVDLCYRLTQAGWDLWYVPSAKVTHYGGSSSSRAAETMYVQLYRSKVQFFRKTGGKRLSRLYKILLALAYTPRLVFATIAALIKPSWAARAYVYKQMLLQVASM